MINNLLIRLAALTMQKALIFGVVAGALYYFMAYNDGSQIEGQLAQIQSQIAEQEKQSQETDAALKEVEQVRVAVAALSDQFKLVSSAIPSDVQMADIIRAVDSVARASGVSVKSKEPKEVSNKEFYEEIPLDITLEGNFSQITMFMYYMTSMQRIMKIKNFSISKDNGSDLRVSSSSSAKLSFQGQVVSYRFIGVPPKKEAEVTK